ncbi:MAG: DUF4091 domain-containing protein [Clostridia bacterium]|nr:DUF4091 domain-containing protein [Clostridia bacterium]
MELRMIKTKIVSSLEKAFLDQRLEDFEQLEHVSVLRGERLSIQLLYVYEGANSPALWEPRRLPIVPQGELAPFASIRRVFSVPVTKAIHTLGTDDNYLRAVPGLYPDLLKPLYYGGKISFVTDELNSAWIEINIPDSFAAGKYTLSFSFDDGEYGKCESSIEIEVIDAVLPREDIYFTQWFHADCLASYYNVDVWSEKHWEIVEHFAKTARRNGINMLLTPVFTPPLDTAVGGERRTTQLVRVAKNGEKYEFDFSLLDRWIDMCNRCGIEYIEISHFFTQWGAAHAPKIMATVDGEYKKIFGWETDATGEEYSVFLRAFLTELLAHLKARNDDKRCFFHVSDEPGLSHLDSYKRAKAIIADLLKGYTIMDALSKFDFYQTGVLDHPIPANNHIKPFLDAGVEGLWTYYCVSQPLEVSNRYISMPSWRNRSIGMQMYKYNIKGFLHWGYNFYNNQYSGDPINPYSEPCADFAFPAGDAFSVYPEFDGTPLESIRLVVFHEALQDIKAMKLAESMTSHNEVVRAIEDVFGANITFDTCAKSADTMLKIRERVNEIIKKHIK